MELRHLRYFTAVAESLSFTEGARRLHISQPPLSQQIRDLELELGTALFTRTNRRVALTEAGTTFLDQARAILDQVNRAVEQSRAIGSGRAGTLDIGLTGSILPGGLGALAAAYGARFPGVAVRLHEMAPDAQEAAIMDRRLDLSFLRHPGGDPALRVELAWPEGVVAVLPRAHPLAARRGLRLADFRGESFVFLRRADSCFARHLWSCCIEAGFEPAVTQEVIEAHSVISLVASGFGVALLPERIRRIPSAVAFRRLAGMTASADVSIAYHPDHGPVVGEFLTFARAWLARAE
ncbi:MAG TPA: LysR family transcriptional regulator [Acetobacteraceae bacterium]|nr:LysR family transcriptional regulator [Acetobacteraceae bacterium]